MNAVSYYRDLINYKRITTIKNKVYFCWLKYRYHLPSRKNFSQNTQSYVTEPKISTTKKYNETTSLSLFHQWTWTEDMKQQN
jgi:hypothetical protein